MQGLDVGPCAQGAMTVGTTCIGADIVGRRNWRVDGGEVGHVAGSTSVRRTEARIQMAVPKGEAGWGQGVIAVDRVVMAVCAGRFMCRADWLDAGTCVAIAGHATWGSGHIARGHMIHVLSWGLFVSMTVQTVGRIGTEGDDILDGGAGTEGWVDIAGGIMAFAAIVEMGKQDIRPVACMVAVRARLPVSLAKVA